MCNRPAIPIYTISLALSCWDWRQFWPTQPSPPKTCCFTEVIPHFLIPEYVLSSRKDRNMAERFTNWLTDIGLAPQWAGYLTWLGMGLGIIVLAWVSNFITKKIVLVVVKRVIRKSRTKWDDVLLERNVFSRLSHLAPAVVITTRPFYSPRCRTYYSAPLLSICFSPDC